MIHQFKIYGEVHGQGRPKVDFNRKRVYKSRRDIQAERAIKDAYVNSGGGYFDKAPLMMIVISHRRLPDYKPKKIDRESDVYKPDASNILKCVEDALNGLAYHDDSQIVLAIPLKAKRERNGIDYLEVILSDEIDEDLLEARVKGLI